MPVVREPLVSNGLLLAQVIQEAVGLLALTSPLLCPFALAPWLQSSSPNESWEKRQWLSSIGAQPFQRSPSPGKPTAVGLFVSGNSIDKSTKHAAEPGRQPLG